MKTLKKFPSFQNVPDSVLIMFCRDNVLSESAAAVDSAFPEWLLSIVVVHPEIGRLRRNRPIARGASVSVDFKSTDFKSVDFKSGNFRSDGERAGSTASDIR